MLLHIPDRVDSPGDCFLDGLVGIREARTIGNRVSLQIAEHPHDTEATQHAQKGEGVDCEVAGSAENGQSSKGNDSEQIHPKER